ncbi:hypothetical protein [Corynebacterium caspium]|uniref:hypothetical protein n=1 Tax=Corynebacterium caspium TaxID=234828 RepID=UPI000372B4F3|nr:hypothetical protein [Corynebacterium caspium]WKD59146.1 hypothetical protein CCASP_03710 [Corynebacterium caspium DSM 44850]
MSAVHQARQQRLIAPDLARGLMLLAILAANILTFWGRNEAVYLFGEKREITDPILMR